MAKRGGIFPSLFACNTLSATIRREIENFFNVKTIGVFPNVESEICKGRKVLLLGTKATASKYKNDKNIIIDKYKT